MLVENDQHNKLHIDWSRQVVYRFDTIGSKMPCRMTTATKIPIANAFPSHCNTRPTLTFNEILRKCKHDMKYQKISSITLTKQICHTSAPWTVVMQRNDHLIFRCLERGKKQITGIFTIAMSGPFLLTQLIYKGTINICLPKGVDFPADFDGTCSANQSSNKSKAI